MAAEPDSSPTPPPVSADRLWAEQLAMGMAILIGLLVFMALFHWKMLAAGGQIFGPNYLAAYGWASVAGIVLHLVVHEAGTLVVAWRLKLPIHFRFFAFGANATTILQSQPRRPWTDAVVGLAGPVTGSVVSGILALVYLATDNPFFLGMACVGCFYNLFTLIPILDLEGGWIAPAIAPEGWFFGLVLTALVLTKQFNLVLLCVLCFAVPRFIHIIRARAPRTDTACTPPQRGLVAILYFVLVLALAWSGSAAFEVLPRLIPEAMSD